MKWHKHLWDASKVYAPDFPRQTADDARFQASRSSRHALVSALRAATETGMPGFYSAYSYPRGHSKDGNIPKVDCIFIDFDVTNDNYDPDKGRDSLAAWRRDMSALLTRTRMVARAIIKDGSPQHFRVVLSGHKGIHLYLDFEPIDPENGSFQQFKSGLESYASDVVAHLDEIAGGVDIRPWVDVDGSDLGRLARHPNTRHHGAVYDDVDRWCIPITIEELAELTVDDYLTRTKEPRPITESMERVPSERAGNQAIQHIRTASTSSMVSSGSASFKSGLASDYDKEANDDIELEDVLFLTKDKPCIEAFREREDAYKHGEASRMMELSIMSRFIEMGVPVDVMHEFFEVIPRYDEDYTESLIYDLTGRRLNEFNCERIAGNAAMSGEAETFCLGEKCGVYRNNPDIQLR